MKYCVHCGTKLVPRELKNEGIIPYCETCQEFRFPIFSVAVSVEVQSPDREKILLIKQYGKDRYILVAGYINKGENAEQTVVREVKEEIGLDVEDICFQKSEYFAPSNTLMLNFSCVAKSEDLSGRARDEVDYCRWFSREEASKNIFPGSLAERFLNRFLRMTGDRGPSPVS